MGILRRLSRWMGKQDHMTHIVAGNTAPGFSLKISRQQGILAQRPLGTRPRRRRLLQSFPVLFCQFTFPFLERLYKRYGGDGATFPRDLPGRREIDNEIREGIRDHFSDSSRRRKRLRGLQRLRTEPTCPRFF